MKRRLSILVAVIIALPLAGCTASSPDQQKVDVTQSMSSLSRFLGVTLVDEQGAVTVDITPLSVEDTVISFEVGMNTHSVDLGMDLTALASLSNDLGLTVTSALWDAPSGGGHHVGGTLVFPAFVAETSLLEGAAQLTLTIRDVGVPERIFVWTVVEES